MPKSVYLLISLFLLVSVAAAFAAEDPAFRTWRPSDAPTADPAKAAVDSFLLMGPLGSGAPYVGNFETYVKTLDPLATHGWSSVDVTASNEIHWQLSDYQQAGGDQAAWCGDLFPSCGAGDPEGGYGNDWNEMIEFRVPVANPALATQVAITASLQVWTEPAYDFVHLSYRTGLAGEFHDLQIWDGPIMDTTGPIAVSDGVTYQPGEYLPGGEIALCFRVITDSSWSDEDCAGMEAWTAGACQVDDITVTVTNDGAPVVYTDDFESGWGHWTGVGAPGVGDFTKVWTGLEDIDPCFTNYTNQVAWIDDGIVVPGTGGSECVTWCYGPNGYVVNSDGGLAGDQLAVHNLAVSPVMNWPDAGHDGLLMEATVFAHMPVAQPFTFYTLRMRSADLDRGQNIADQPWISAGNFFGDPFYLRQVQDWTVALEAGRDQVQVAVGLRQFPSTWPTSPDPTPAPYFDNIRLVTYVQGGPVFAFDELNLAQDAFPAAAVDPNDLGAATCRFDMAGNISPLHDFRNDPGDSIVIDCVAARAGSELVVPPVLHWTLDANPLFDPYRTATPPNPVTAGGGNQYSGFWFDLPDTGFLFPGDRLQYYFSAIDAVGGLDPRVATLPADLTAYGDFGRDSEWDVRFEVNMLPTVRAFSSEEPIQAKLLLWNDAGDADLDAMWISAIQDYGLLRGRDFDVYRTQRPDADGGNGLGGRASLGVIGGYEDIFYTSGDQSSFCLRPGDEPAHGDDVELLTAWLESGQRDLFLTGENLFADLDRVGASTFAETWAGVEYVTHDLRPLINNQVAPVVFSEPYSWPSQPVFLRSDEWVVYGGCPEINRFDAVYAAPGAQRLAWFSDPGGFDVYSLSAATLMVTGPVGAEARVLSLTYDPVVVYAAVKDASMTQDDFVADVLEYFGWYKPGDAPEAVRFAVGQNEPNPFNPITTIRYTMPREGRLSMAVYDLRGRLVRTLHDGVVAAGDGSVVWNGTDAAGRDVPSGVYFCETRADGRRSVQKMALVR